MDLAKGMRWLALRRPTTWVSIVVVTVLAGGELEARERGGRRGKQPEESILDQLVRECKLSEAQQADVRAKIEARDGVLAEWDRENAEKMQAAEAAAKDARSGNDGDLKKSTSRELRELRTARDESATEAAAAILSVLEPEQKATWDGYLLYQATVARYRRAELSEEQSAKIRAACDVAAGEIGEIGEDSKAGKAKRAITDKLRWAVDIFVLTSEQREALSKRPSRKGKKGKREQDPGGVDGGPATEQ